MSELKIFQIERPWGNFRQFIANSPCTVKIITILPNESLSLQSHEKRGEFWRVLSGSGVIEIGDMKYNVSVGEEHQCPVGVKHRMSAGEHGLTILEVATGEFDENDITRYQDKYGRA